MQPFNQSGIQLEPGEVLIPENITPDMPSIPLQDRHGRPRWIPTRECWCPPNAPTDCRFHNQEEEGWAECPHKPRSSTELEAKKPRRLFGKNPDFGKPLVEEEVPAESVSSQEESA